MTVQRKSSRGDLSETLTQVGQRASSEDLRLVVQDESQGDAEEHLGAFIEKTVPDPQNRLPVKDTRELDKDTNTLQFSLTSIGRTST